MNYLILGANAAGLSAAMRIIKADKQARITVLEKGTVVSFGACGIPYYVGGEFDDIETMTSKPLEELLELGIDIRLQHSATALDPQTKQVTALNSLTNQSISLSYDKLLIAVGAAPQQLAIPGIGLAHSMHSKADALALRALLPQVQKVVIIGGGFIGVEAAEALIGQGKQLTLIEYAPRILARTFDAEITAHLENALQRHGVDLQLHQQVCEITGTQGRVTAVATEVASYPADLVIAATGFKPNTAFLADSGIRLSREGAILINDQCQTSLADVYAAGDCATVPHRISGDEYIPLATTANKLGRIAGEVMSGKASRFIGTLGSSGIRAFDMEAGRTGITEQQARDRGLNYATVFIQDMNRTDYIPGQTPLWVKLIVDKSSRRLLGGQLCGSYGGGAVHRVDALAVAIYSGLTVDELGYMDFVYAPPFARTWDALNIAGNVAK